jgi:hypothetical protein
LIEKKLKENEFWKKNAILKMMPNKISNN